MVSLYIIGLSMAVTDLHLAAMGDSYWGLNDLLKN